MKMLRRLLLPLVCIGMIPIAMAADNRVADHPG